MHSFFFTCCGYDADRDTFQLSGDISADTIPDAYMIAMNKALEYVRNREYICPFTVTMLCLMRR